MIELGQNMWVKAKVNKCILKSEKVNKLFITLFHELPSFGNCVAVVSVSTAFLIDSSFCLTGIRKQNRVVRRVKVISCNVGLFS